MTICPIAIAVGCQKCPIFKICPVKSVLGDVPKVTAAKPVPTPSAKQAAKPAAKGAANSTKKALPKAAASRKKSG
jgi:hypothetical protein